MYRKNLEKTLEVIKDTVLEHYVELVSKTNSDEGHEMVLFCREVICTRNEGNWGREEEEERIIGIDKNGWIILTHRVHFGAGKLVIDNINISKKSTNDIVNVIRNDSLRIGEYYSFFEKASEISEKYKLYL